jgi:hypothetical protein
MVLYRCPHGQPNRWMRFADTAAPASFLSDLSNHICAPPSVKRSHTPMLTPGVLAALKLINWKLLHHHLNSQHRLADRFYFEDARLQFDPTSDHGQFIRGRGCTCCNRLRFEFDHQPRNSARILVRLQPDVPSAVFSAPSGGRAGLVSACSPHSPPCSSPYRCCMSIC